MTPPLAFTQLKYALIMFGPSVKSVPGWWVSIVPMLIGVPVAATPGLGPHDEMLVDTAALELAAADELAAAVLELLLLLLLPHPATTSASAATRVSRTPLSGTMCLVVLTNPLLSSGVKPAPDRPRSADTNCASGCMQPPVNTSSIKRLHRVRNARLHAAFCPE